MPWTATALLTATDLTPEQVADIAVDVDGGVSYDAARGVLRVTYEVAAPTHQHAVTAAQDHLVHVLPALRVDSLTVLERPFVLEDSEPGRQVNELGPGMRGCWLVTTQGSRHVWDLDTRTYTRIPGSRSGSGPFAFDRQPMTITHIERWPRVGSTSLAWYDDPTDPEHLEHWRQSSPITSITEIRSAPNSGELSGASSVIESHGCSGHVGRPRRRS